MRTLSHRVPRTTLSQVRGIYARHVQDPRGASCARCAKLLDYIGFEDDLNWNGDEQPFDECRIRIHCCHDSRERCLISQNVHRGTGCGDRIVVIDMGGRGWRVDDAMSRFRRMGGFFAVEDANETVEAAVRGMASAANEEDRPERAVEKPR
jgi:hypothetical protein